MRRSTSRPGVPAAVTVRSADGREATGHVVRFEGVAVDPVREYAGPSEFVDAAETSVAALGSRYLDADARPYALVREAGQRVGGDGPRRVESRGPHAVGGAGARRMAGVAPAAG